MATTPILDLETPVQGAPNWHIPINANFNGIDEKLGQAYRNMWVVDAVTYISNNAKYVTDHWERWDTTKGAYLIKIDGDANTRNEYYCLSGLGTIVWIEKPEYEYTAVVSEYGDTTVYSDLSEVICYGSPLVLMKTFTIPDSYDSHFKGTFKMQFDLKGSYTAPPDGENKVGSGYIYRNSTFISKHQVSGHHYRTIDAPVYDCKGGDVINLYGQGTNEAINGTRCGIKNFYVKGTQVSKVLTFDSNGLVVN